MEEPLPAPLHLVPEPGDVFQGDLRLRRHGAALLEGQTLRRLEADLLPFQRPRRLLRGYGADVDGQVHGRSRRHQPLDEAGGEGAGPLAQVQRADEAVPDAHLASAHLHLDGCVIVELSGRSAEERRYEEHAELAASEGVDGQPGPR